MNMPTACTATTPYLAFTSSHNGALQSLSDVFVHAFGEVVALPAAILKSYVTLISDQFGGLWRCTTRKCSTTLYCMIVYLQQGLQDDTPHASWLSDLARIS